MQHNGFVFATVSSQQ